MSNARALENLIDAIEAMPGNEALSDDILVQFHRLRRQLMKKACKVEPNCSLKQFESEWIPQTLQFTIDVIPYVHNVLKRHYLPKDELSFIDVGCGNGAGADLISRLHSARMIYSKLSVHGIDYIDRREQWIKLNYPSVNFEVRDLFNISEQYDIVFCSHCIEHVEEVEAFVGQLCKISKGFCFVYAPYNETNRIDSHINTITKSLFQRYSAEIHIMQSMAWHPGIPEDECILAVIDCRG